MASLVASLRVLLPEVAGTTFARFRVSTAGGLGPTGDAADGEVEDYAVSAMVPGVDTAILIDDPMNPGKKVLVTTGTKNNDDIQIQLTNKGVVLCKRGCKIATYSLSQVGRIVIMGGAGNDKLTVPTNLNMPVEMYGCVRGSTSGFARMEMRARFPASCAMRSINSNSALDSTLKKRMSASSA